MFRLQVCPWRVAETLQRLYFNISGGLTLELSCPTGTAECPWDCDCPTRHQRGSTKALWCTRMLTCQLSCQEITNFPLSLIYWMDSIWFRSWFNDYGPMDVFLCGCVAFAPLCCPLVPYWWTWKTVIWLGVTWYDLVPSRRPSLPACGTPSSAVLNIHILAFTEPINL